MPLPSRRNTGSVFANASTMFVTVPTIAGSSTAVSGWASATVAGGGATAGDAGATGGFGGGTATRVPIVPPHPRAIRATHSARIGESYSLLLIEMDHEA